MVRWLMAGAAAAGIASAATAAEAPSERAQLVIEAARQACAGYPRGQFAAGGDAITAIDLTGDGVPEEIIDESTFRCSSAASLYCGTGGCMVRIIADGETVERLAKAWRIVEWGESLIVLFALHGTACGSSGVDPCYEAIVWAGDHFRSVRPPADGR